MNLETYKAQAHRLQAFAQAHPQQAERLAQGKQSAAYAAIAAIHGSRNWNTLSAIAHGNEPVQVPAGCEHPPELDLSPLELFGQFNIRDRVLTMEGPVSPLSLSTDLVQAVAEGYSVTTLSLEPTLRTLAAAMEGGGGALLQADRFKPAAAASFLAFDLAGKPETLGQALQAPSDVFDFLLGRSRQGALLVLQDVASLAPEQSAAKDRLVELVLLWAERGGTVLMTSPQEGGVRAWEWRICADSGTVVHRLL